MKLRFFALITIISISSLSCEKDENNLSLVGIWNFQYSEIGSERHMVMARPSYEFMNDGTFIKILGDFNWRTRSVGAFYAALKGLTGFQDQVGGLLLKSEVCYAGTSYCLTLTVFNNQKSIDYLNQYLEYYLAQKDLWFDQGDAMGAVAYLDKQNGTDVLKQHLVKWSDFVSNKEMWDLDKSIGLFEDRVIALKEIKKYASLGR